MLGICVIGSNVDEARNEVIKVSAAVAEHRKISLKKTGMFDYLSTKLMGPFRAFFTRRDPLRDKILDESGKVRFDKVRQVYLEREMARYPDDPIVKAIALGSDKELLDELSRGISSVDKFRVYVEIATILPNELAEYWLIDELDPDKTHSPKLLNRLEDDDYIEILSEFVKRHNKAVYFKRLFIIHPLGINAARFLNGVLDEMSTSSGEIFIDYLHACRQIGRSTAVPTKGFSISTTLADYCKNLGKNKQRPINVALGLLYLYVEEDNAGTAKSNALSILERTSDDQIPELLRGINAILSVSSRLSRYAWDWSGHAKMRELTKIVLYYDPNLSVALPEELISILEMLELMKRNSEEHGHVCRDLDVLEVSCDSWLYDLTVPNLGFALRTELVDIRKAKKGLGWLVDSYQNEYQKTMVRLMDILLKLEPLEEPCITSGTVTNIALGDVLTGRVFKNITYGDATAMVYTVLAYIFSLPTSTFHLDVPLGHLDPIDHLNLRMSGHCGNSTPAAIFHAKSVNKRRVWNEEMQVVVNEEQTTKSEKGAKNALKTEKDPNIEGEAAEKEERKRLVHKSAEDKKLTHTIAKDKWPTRKTAEDKRLKYTVVKDKRLKYTVVKDKRLKYTATKDKRPAHTTTKDKRPAHTTTNDKKSTRIATKKTQGRSVCSDQSKRHK
ncbi:hypothetical protein PSACC_01752 [Paramicrosporidium saccamoebae]|uniref:Uncharacterized protein n=1 Tax=Paramicrosporidium saccamoebae TaxID=1246581 RepID=A0A2H9TKY3_9FUNG|nr:hypothetical protein PSACC_01752 [Paramicrosporidium saccamoebae]